MLQYLLEAIVFGIVFLLGFAYGYKARGKGKLRW